MSSARISWALALSSVLALSACATAGPELALTRVPLGRDANGNSCTATRTYQGLTGREADAMFAITCGGAFGTRPLGRVEVALASRAGPDKTELCGQEIPAVLDGLGPVRVRRCLDEMIGFETVAIAFDRGGRRYRGAATASVQGQLEYLLKLVAGGAPTPLGPDAVAERTISTETLAALPEGMALPGDSGSINVEAAVREGTRLNRRGEYLRASRNLNDAISRLPADTPAADRVDLALEAALADSNIRQRESAARHFATAEKLLNDTPDMARRAFLERKKNSYLALNALNERNFRAAAALLAASRTSDPLQDPVVLAEANQASGNDLNATTSVDGERFEQLVLDAQRNWATSVALSASTGASDLAGSREALGNAVATLRALLSFSPDPSAILWLVAQVERQSARLDVLEGQGSAESLRTALAKYDCALNALRNVAPQSEQGCAVPIPETARARLARATVEVAGPILAETQLDRAALLARSGAPQAQVQADYDRAVDDIIRLARVGGPAPVGMEAYLDLLVERHAADQSPEVAEAYFKAAQALSGGARSAQALQSVAASDPATATKVRALTNLDREIVALRYNIASTSDADLRAQLETQRAEQERAAQRLNDELQNTRFARVDDRPATVAEVQASLRPGEVYWKLTELRTRLYGIVIGKDGVTVYPVRNSAREVTAREVNLLSRVVRRSIVSSESAKLPLFAVSASSSLFELIAGPAKSRLLAAREVVVDPSGPLNGLPPGILVTDVASARAYRQSVKTRPNDYSNVAFFAKQASLQTALSPRSFLISRSLAPSAAPQPLIGLGEHVVPTAATPAVSFNTGCSMTYQQLLAVEAIQRPIPAERLTVVANALGVPAAPRIVGAAFTDVAVQRNDNLDKYQVLHFSTHGLTQVRQGCDIPPSLITTAAPDGSDGFLTFEEVAGMQLDANLVVLAACSTYAGVSGQLAQRSGAEGEGSQALSGLVRAFLAANARAVLATYWDVSIGAESDDLFREFYSRGRTSTIGESLKSAQLSLASDPRYSHPFFWGAYFVVGDATKPMLSANSEQLASR